MLGNLNYLIQCPPKPKKNQNWIVRILPEDCRNIFICVDEELFDERVKHGMIPLHDDRNNKGISVPCFIGYMPTADLTDLDKLVGLPMTKQDEAQAAVLHNRAEPPVPSQEFDNGKE